MNEKHTSTKTYIILAMFLATVFVSPAVSPINAQDGTAASEIPSSEESLQALQGALGQMFGMFREFGASGETLAAVFELMFQDFQSMNATKKSDGVFVLNASINQDPEQGQINYTNANGTWTYEPWGQYTMENASTEYQDEFPYFKYEHNGSIDFNQTEGVSVTLIIWDRDNSFIDALDRLIAAVKEFIRIDQDETITDQEKLNAAIEEAVETITYFLIHINDIINGDEVIIGNFIAFTDYEADIGGSFDATWYSTKDGTQTDNVELSTVYSDFKTDFNQTAKAYGDEWMYQLLNRNWSQGRYQNYTAFSFDLVEIWLKNFHIEIDVNAILEAVNNAADAAQTGTEPEGPLTDATLTEVFDGLDIEFYVFTHHFQNWYMYDDNKFDSSIYSQEVQDKAGNGVPDVVFGEVGTYNNQPVEKINASEVTHHMVFRGADQWIFNEPEYTGSGADDTFKMDWGITAQKLDFRCLPIGLDDDEVGTDVAPVETMDYYSLGFSFAPTKSQTVESGEWTGDAMGVAKVKLVQEFGEWNEGSGPNTPALQSKDLDLATVFMSSVFHFHLNIENEKISNQTLNEDDPLLTENNYNKSSNQINVGSSAAGANDANAQPIGAVDIAGPDYQKYSDETSYTNHSAKTNIIPTLYAQWEGEASQTYEQKDGSVGALSGTLELEFSLLLYAVSYDVFDSSGDKLVHDPTFSVFISTENAFAWAVVLVIGTVVLVGVAAIMITKKKDKAAGLE